MIIEIIVIVETYLLWDCYLFSCVYPFSTHSSCLLADMSPICYFHPTSRGGSSGVWVEATYRECSELGFVLNPSWALLQSPAWKPRNSKPPVVFIVFTMWCQVRTACCWVSFVQDEPTRCVGILWKIYIINARCLNSAALFITNRNRRISPVVGGPQLWTWQKFVWSRF